MSETPKLAGARRIVVKPVPNDTRIRYADWVRETRLYVDRASHGQIGIHPPLRHAGIRTPAVRARLSGPVEQAWPQGGSDCETLALEFKDFGLGRVIGTRTWGGWIGIRGDKPLRDGGITTQPEYGGWDPRGRGWQIEGHGVDPDVVLDLSPDGFMDGKDEQLDYAIQDLMAKIAKGPRDLPKAPPLRPRPLSAAR